MDAMDSPSGDVYDLDLEFAESITLPGNCVSFSVRVHLKNKSTQTWDTSGRLRLAVILIESHTRGEADPPRVVELRSSLPADRFAAGQECFLPVTVNVNQLPPSQYLFIADLVVETSYFLANTGAKRLERTVEIMKGLNHEYNEFVTVSTDRQVYGRPWRLDPRVHAVKQTFNLYRLEGSCNGSVINITWGPFFIRHYVHFLEFVICLYSIYREYTDGGRIVLCIGREPLSYLNNPDVQRFLLNALFDDWEVKYTKDLSHAKHANQNCHFIDFDGFRMNRQTNRLIVDYFDLVEDWFDNFKLRCVGRIKSNPSSPRKRVAIYAKRKLSRVLMPEVERELFEIVTSYGYFVEEVDFGSLTIEQQIVAANSASLMYGPHGNNLTNCIWMKPKTLVIEVFPSGFHTFDFQIFCELAGVRYLGCEGRSDGFVHRDGTRTPDWRRLDDPYQSHQYHQDNIAFLQKEVVNSFLRNYSLDI